MYWFEFPILLFLPGMFVLFIVLKKYNIIDSTWDLVLAGAIFWNFIFIASMTLIALFSSAIVPSFQIFTIVSVFLVFFGFLIFIIKKFKKKTRFSIRISKTNILLLFFLLALLTFIITSIIYSSTLFSEYDPIKLYLPLSKSIITSGGLQTDPYHVNDLFMTSDPAISLMFAWIIWGAGSETLIILPVIIFLLTTITVFSLATELFLKKEIALISAIIFASLPVVMGVFVTFNLYRDIYFIFYILTALLFLIKGGRTSRKLYFLLAGMSASLALLTSSMAIFIVPFLFSICLLLAQKTRTFWVILLCSLISTLPFMFLFAWDLLSGLEFNQIIVRETLVCFFTVIIFLVLHFFDTKSTSGNKGKNHFFFIVYFSLPVLPILIFFYRNITQFGAINSEWIPSNFNLNTAKALLSPVTDSVTPVYLNYIRFDNLFTNLLLSGLYIIPISVGIFFVYKKMRLKLSLALVLFVIFSIGLVLFWAWTFQCSFLGSEFRRLYYFAPFLSIAMGFGIYSLMTLLNRKHYGVRFVLFITSLTLYFYLVKLNINNAPSLSGPFYQFGIASLMDLAIGAVLFAIFFLLDVNSSLLEKIRKRSIHIKGKARIVIVPVICSMLLLIPFTPFFSNIIANPVGNRSPDINYENGILGVADYYKTNITDDYTTLTFYGYELILFANRTILEFTKPQDVSSILPILTSSNSTEIIQKLTESNIRYFLIPRQSHSAYDYFKSASDKFSLFSVINYEPNFVIAKVFEKMVLFKLLDRTEVENSVAFSSNFKSSWATITNATVIQNSISTYVQPSGELNKSITDENQLNFWSSLNDKRDINFTNDNSVFVNGKDSLRIDIFRNQSLSFWHSFSEFQDFSEWESIKLFFYGENTSMVIPVIFHTNSWTDYYYANIIDSFTGWKEITFELGALAKMGTPSWKQITKIEVLLGNLPAQKSLTYYLDDFKLEGRLIGIKNTLPEIVTPKADVSFTISINIHNNSKINMIATSENGTITYIKPLVSGRNDFSIPSYLFVDKTTVYLSYYAKEYSQTTELFSLNVYK